MLEEDEFCEANGDNYSDEDADFDSDLDFDTENWIFISHGWYVRNSSYVFQIKTYNVKLLNIFSKMFKISSNYLD